ncbi:MAG TPA: DUF3352 domain-containing protein [Candidatus Caenarcaniphilales bacterium]|nr:DUF3352 domain-containing protein [Candidatus Caenarcaniphilales bacterium]
MTVTTPDSAAVRDSPPFDSPHLADPAQPILERVRPHRRFGSRAAAALLTVLALVLIVGTVAFASFDPASPSVLLRYAPSESIAYAELRLDLPGDQREQVLAFMAHFPGFSDAGAVEQRIAEAFDEAASESGEELAWERDVKPWFGGQLAVIIPSPGEDDGEDDRPRSRWVIGLSVKDRAAAEKLIAQHASTSGRESDEHRGATVWTGNGGRRPALALTDDALLLSERLADLHKALDVAAGERPGLADDERFSDPIGNLQPDRLATFYLDGEAVAELADDRMAALEMAAEPYAGLLGGRTVAELRAEGDHLVLLARMRPGPEAPPLPSNRMTELASYMPPDSAVYFETRDTGAGIKRSLTTFLERAGGMDADDGFEPQIETMLGMPVEDYLDFLDDAAVAVSFGGGQPSGGLVATVTDDLVARQRLERLVGLLRTAVAFETLPIIIEEEQHADTTITFIRPRDDSDTGDSDMEDYPMGAPELSFPGIDRLPSIGFAFTDDGLLLVGVDDFVRDALDRESDGLAATDSYRTALEAGGSENAGVAYLDLAALRQLMEKDMDERERVRYEREIQPYLAPFTRVVSVTVREGDELVSRTLVYVE